MESEVSLQLNREKYARVSPVDGSTTWSGSWVTPDEIDAVIRRTKESQSAWGSMDLESRIRPIQRYGEFLDQQRAEIARCITLESGKPLWESRTEVQAAISKIANAIEAIRSRRWTTHFHSAPNTIRYRPLGLMLVLGPYNLPLHLPGAHFVPALLAGNSVVFKPSEKTPAVGEWIDRGWKYSGLPEGVFHMMHGAADQAKCAVAHQDIDGVLFTGSQRAGVEIHRQLAGRTECLLALELGGNNPMVIDHVSDHASAVTTVIQSAYITSGQRCTCARRIILLRSKENEVLLKKLVSAIGKIRVDDPLSSNQPFMGTLVSPESAASILEAQRKLEARGAEILKASQRLYGNESMLSPSLCIAEPNMEDDEEHFGPLATVTWAQDLEHAIELSNRTRYGLAASLLSDSREAFDYFVSRVRAGIVNWNAPSTGASGRLPFGGIGASGNHRPSGYFAADYCSDPIASVEIPHLVAQPLPPGLEDV